MNSQFNNPNAIDYNIIQYLEPKYLIVQHMEPDHSANIMRFLKEYPDTYVVGNAKTFKIMEQFFHEDIKNKKKPIVTGITVSSIIHKKNYSIIFIKKLLSPSTKFPLFFPNSPYSFLYSYCY